MMAGDRGDSTKELYFLCLIGTITPHLHQCLMFQNVRQDALPQLQIAPDYKYNVTPMTSVTADELKMKMKH